MMYNEKKSCNESDSIKAMKSVFFEQRKAYADNPYPTISSRIKSLKQLKLVILQNQQQIVEALSADFGHRSHHETRIAEILTFAEGINSAIKQIGKWAKPDKRKVGLLFLPAKNQIIYQPLGIIGVIVPWNYPLFLSLGPLIGAISAGNRVMIKLSEFTPQFNQCLMQLLATVFDERHVAIITGELEVSAQFSSLAFNHLFFTGSTQVGHLVMMAAAKNLTPVTLELGGKSPALITSSVDMKLAAERICFGKSMNAGQTCVAPDYVLCPKDKKQAFIEAYAEAFCRMYPCFKNNEDYSSIINDSQFERLQSLIEDAKSKGARVIKLDTSSENTTQLRKMPPILIDDVKDDLRVMQEELFSPILPIVEYETLDQAIEYITTRSRPLALYIFSFNQKEQQKILYNTHSGSVCINNTLTQLAQEYMPFGGVGESGMGQYHGYEGFLTFSKAKAVHKVGWLNTGELIPKLIQNAQRLLRWV